MLRARPAPRAQRRFRPLQQDDGVLRVAAIGHERAEQVQGVQVTGVGGEDLAIERFRAPKIPRAVVVEREFDQFGGFHGVTMARDAW